MSVVDAGQVLAESRMRDTVTVTRPTGGTGSVDAVTGVESDPAATAVWSGPCRFRSTYQANAQEVAGARFETTQPTLSVPVSAPRLLVGDVAVITAVPVGDPAGHLRLNLRMRVTGLVLATDMTAQRVQVQVVTG